MKIQVQNKFREDMQIQLEKLIEYQFNKNKIMSLYFSNQNDLDDAVQQIQKDFKIILLKLSDEMLYEFLKLEKNNKSRQKP